MSTTFNVSGMEDVQSKLAALIRKYPEETQIELERWAYEVLNAANREVPWDTTHLKQTGKVTAITDGKTSGFAVGYGAFSGEYNYGLRQHEDLTLHHPHGKAKFLEDPFNRVKGKIAPGIAKKLKQISVAK